MTESDSYARTGDFLPLDYWNALSSARSLIDLTCCTARLTTRPTRRAGPSPQAKQLVRAAQVIEDHGEVMIMVGYDSAVVALLRNADSSDENARASEELTLRSNVATGDGLADAEPFCMIVPFPRGLLESLSPSKLPLDSDAEVSAGYRQ